MDWISTVISSGKPFFGICFSAQLLAKVLGVTVARHPQGKAEMGYHRSQHTLGVNILTPSCIFIIGIWRDLSYL
ncbi:MAG: hypothetical protein F6K55_23915 [Moorea sp. SIO4A3]|nr:hypothetical protein [Moorena sp. SIO4A3]